MGFIPDFVHWTSNKKKYFFFKQIWREPQTFTVDPKSTLNSICFKTLRSTSFSLMCLRVNCELEVFPRNPHDYGHLWDGYLANSWSPGCTLEWPLLKLVSFGLFGLAVGLVVMHGLSSCPVTFCCGAKCRCGIPFLPLLWHHFCSQEHAQLVPICQGISGVGTCSPPCSHSQTTGIENILAVVTWENVHLNNVS